MVVVLVVLIIDYNLFIIINTIIFCGRNFELAMIDEAIRVDDQSVVDMAHWLYRNEGLFVGSSSALNIAAACIAAKALHEGATVVTIICDSWYRHLSRFWNSDYLKAYNLLWPDENVIPKCLQ